MNRKSSTITLLASVAMIGAVPGTEQSGVPIWNPDLGQWDGGFDPVVNVAAYTNAYAAEINSGGGIVYGYNWNAKSAVTGTYRLTFVLDGNDAQGPVRTTPLATKFVRAPPKSSTWGRATPGAVNRTPSFPPYPVGAALEFDPLLSSKAQKG